MTVRRSPRALHPAAWWLWAIGLGIAASRTSNPLLLLMILAVVGVVVASRRSDAPWARALPYYLALAGSAIVIRVALRIAFGGGIGPSDHIIARLPQLPLPGWASGIHLGGPVSLQASVYAAVDGLRLGTLLCCIGAANALANPKRALRVLPGAIYELGVAVVVCMTVAPQLIDSVQRVRRAHRLRGGPTRGRRALRGVVIPVMEDALERSLRLAASMDSRGYARTGKVSRRTRGITSALLLGGLLALAAGVYGLLDDTTPRLLGLPAFGAGCVLCGLGLWLGGRRVQRSSYRPDPWRWAEWVVVLSAVVPAVAFFLVAHHQPLALDPSFSPMAWPSLPADLALAVLVPATAAVAAPPPVRRTPVVDTAPARRRPLEAAA